MNRFTKIFPESFYNVHILWDKTPVKLTENWAYLSDKDQSNIFLYKIFAKRGDKCKLIYIGMSQNQSIQMRLYNKDHQLKQKFMREQNKGWVLYVSTGEYVNPDEDDESFKWSKKNVSIIENLLIIGHSHMESLINKKNVRWFSSGYWITIYNKGLLRDGMHKTLSYGLFKR